MQLYLQSRLDPGPRSNHDAVMGSSSSSNSQRSPLKRNQDRTQAAGKLGSDFAAMALLSSVASAATSRVAVAPCTSRPSVSWRHGELGFSAPGIFRIPKCSAGKCRAQAVETVSPVAERPLWVPGSNPPAYLDGTYVSHSHSRQNGV